MSANLAFLTLRSLRKTLRSLREISLTQRTQRENRKERRGFSLCTLRDLCVLCGFVLFFNSAAYSQSDKFGGIGVSVDIDSSVMQPYIVDILSGKPGAMAGLRSGDHIISINHWNTKGKSQEQVANKLRGRVGSQVDLDIDRGGKQMDFVMKRENVIVPDKNDNFCVKFDLILKSTIDSFKTIQGDFISQPNKYEKDYASKIQIPGFDSAKILRNVSWGDAEYAADYFIGKDSTQAMSEFRKLRNEINDCIPYTIVQSYKEYPENPPDISFTYYLQSVKNKKYTEVDEWVISIRIEKDENHMMLVHLWIDHPAKM